MCGCVYRKNSHEAHRKDKNPATHTGVAPRKDKRLPCRHARGFCFSSFTYGISKPKTGVLRRFETFFSEQHRLYNCSGHMLTLRRRFRPPTERLGREEAKKKQLHFRYWECICFEVSLPVYTMRAPNYASNARLRIILIDYQAYLFYRLYSSVLQAPRVKHSGVAQGPLTDPPKRQTKARKRSLPFFSRLVRDKTRRGTQETRHTLTYLHGRRTLEARICGCMQHSQSSRAAHTGKTESSIYMGNVPKNRPLLMPSIPRYENTPTHIVYTQENERARPIVSQQGNTRESNRAISPCRADGRKCSACPECAAQTARSHEKPPPSS